MIRRKFCKTFIAFLLAAGMAVPAYAQTDSMTLNVYSQEEEYTVDYSQNVNATAFYGLWQRTVEVNGAEREFCLYVPNSYKPGIQLAVIIPPNGLTSADFAKNSVWPSVCEESNVSVLILEPSDGKWQDYDTENAYITECINAIGDMVRTGDRRYLIGYGEGATLGQEYMLRNPVSLSGAVILGGEDIPEEKLNEIGNTLCAFLAADQTEEGNFNKDCDLPVWIVNDENANQALTDYLKAANDVIDEPLSNEYADQIFNQRNLSGDNDRNNQAVSRVWISQKENASQLYTDKDFTDYMWNGFLSEIVRYPGRKNGALRKAYTLEDIGIQMHSKKMDHASFDEPVERSWGVYVPDSYTGETSVPLVVATHGFTGSIDYFVHNTEWWRVADEYGCIVVFTQATPNDGALSGTARWRSGALNSANAFPDYDTEETLQSEISYFKYVVDDVCENYNIDRTRVYCTGHSNGSEMTYDLSVEMDDVFAATCQVGYSVKQYDSFENMPETNTMMPYYNIECEYDRSTDPDNIDDSLYWDIGYRLHINGLDTENTSYTEVDLNKYTTRTYADDAGVPLVQFSLYEGSDHAYSPDIAYMAWNFLSNFSRGEDGTTYYQGEAVEK